MDTSPSIYSDTSSSTSPNGTYPPGTHVSTSPPVGIKEAAEQLRVSVNTVRRWIREGKLQTEKQSRPQGYTLLVHLPVDGQVLTDAPTQTGAQVDAQAGVHESPAHQVPTEQVPALAEYARAEAMATYSAKLLEPLVARLAEQEQIIRQLAEEKGQHQERLSHQAERIQQLEAQLATSTAEVSFWQRWFGWLGF
jgi:DNA-binding transcriptional MerR regulator